MLRKVKVDDAGDTNMLPGGLVDVFDFGSRKCEVIAEGLRPASAQTRPAGHYQGIACHGIVPVGCILPGDHKGVDRSGDKGKVDPLVGLKENVIIRKLIPAGTGMSRYKDINISTVSE